MAESFSYNRLKENNLISLVPPSAEQILSAETPRNLFELAHISSARRESLMSGLANPDDSIDQFGQPVGRFSLPGAEDDGNNKASAELDLIEQSWIRFYRDAIADGNQIAADFVFETVLQFFGFDPEIKASE